MVTFFDSKHRPIAHMFRKKKYVELSYPGYTLHGDIFLKHNEINWFSHIFVANTANK